jgi:hypothetical protein
MVKQIYKDAACVWWALKTSLFFFVNKCFLHKDKDDKTIWLIWHVLSFTKPGKHKMLFIQITLADNLFGILGANIRKIKVNYDLGSKITFFIFDFESCFAVCLAFEWKKTIVYRVLNAYHKNKRNLRDSNTPAWNNIGNKFMQMYDANA